MIVTQQEFEKIVTTAVNATTAVWDSMQKYIEISEEETKAACLGDKVYNDITSFPDVLHKVQEVVSLAAFADAIPFLDLVLTPTGFGVVSNENLVPASRDRVNALQTATIAARDRAIDLLIGILHAFCPDWSTSEQGKALTSSLIWDAEYLRNSGGYPQATRSTLKELRPVISQAESILREAISSDYFNYIIDGRRAKTLQSQDVLIWTQAQLGCMYFCRKEKDAFERILRFIVNTIDENPDLYPIYAASDAYKLKHFSRYENKKEDSCFMWG